MRKLIIGVLFTCLFSIGATCGGDGGGSSTSNVGTIGGEGPVNAVPEPSSLLLGTTGALLIGLAIRRSRR
jgi:hypothetical protein